MKQNAALAIFITLLLCTSFASALGVTPARTTLDFKPNLKESIGITVIGSSDPQDLSISVSGELAEYVTPSTRSLGLAKDESKKFSYDIALPSTLEPGLHTADVIILQNVQNNDRVVVQATLAVKTQLHIHVPFPGKYAKADVFISELEDGTLQFAIPVSSAGEYDLASVRANVDILNALGEKIDSFNTQSIAIPSGEKKDLVYNWKLEANVGNYLAVITLIYDGETKRLEKPFRIGNRLLELQEIRADNFELGQIAKFEMLVENKWSEAINDVFVDTKIYDEREQVLSSFKSPVESIPALSKKVFVSFWDTAGFTQGLYRTEVAINYGETEQVKKDLQFEVAENELTVIGLGYVISEGGDATGSGNLTFILIIAIVVLVLINLLWFLVLRKRLKK